MTAGHGVEQRLTRQCILLNGIIYLGRCAVLPCHAHAPSQPHNSHHRGVQHPAVELCLEAPAASFACPGHGPLCGPRLPEAGPLHAKQRLYLPVAGAGLHGQLRPQLQMVGCQTPAVLRYALGQGTGHCCISGGVHAGTRRLQLWLSRWTGASTSSPHSQASSPRHRRAGPFTGFLKSLSGCCCSQCSTCRSYRSPTYRLLVRPGSCPMEHDHFCFPVQHCRSCALTPR